MGDPITMGAVMVGSQLVGAGANALFKGDDEEGGVTGYADTMTPLQQRNLGNLNQLIDQNMGRGVESYGGDYTAGASGNQQQTFDLVQQLLGGGGGMGQSQDFLQNLTKPYDPTSANEFFNKGIRDPTMKDWEENTLPSIQEHFIGQNAGRSGAANRAISGSGADLMAMLSGEKARTLYGDKQQYTQNALQGVSQNAQIQELMTKLGLTAGGTERGIEGEQRMEGFQDWQTEQAYNNPWLNKFMTTALGGQAKEPIVQQPYQNQGVNAGDMMKGAAAFMPFLSDGGNNNVSLNGQMKPTPNYMTQSPENLPG